jgi:nucleotide-binding universal stress UspA family protein
MSFNSQEGNLIMDATHKIMVAVAFTEYSAELLDYAAGIADSIGAEMIVVNIINSRDVEAVGTIAAMGYELDSKQKMLEKISFPAERIRSVFRVGHPVEELLRIALKENVNLIVMGIKGRSDLEHMLVGSVAEKVFRRSPIPILSYRDTKNAERFKKHIGIK